MELGSIAHFLEVKFLWLIWFRDHTQKCSGATLSGWARSFLFATVFHELGSWTWIGLRWWMLLGLSLKPFWAQMVWNLYGVSWWTVWHPFVEMKTEFWRQRRSSGSLTTSRTGLSLAAHQVEVRFTREEATTPTGAALSTLRFMTCFMSTVWRLPRCHGNQPGVARCGLLAALSRIGNFKSGTNPEDSGGGWEGVESKG